jgi:2-dehydropantoate 2-reductase
MKIGIYGAGAIGCYLGGRLISGGADVVLLGRPALAGEIAAHGLRITDYRGADLHLAPECVRIETEPDMRML